MASNTLAVERLHADDAAAALVERVELHPGFERLLASDRGRAAASTTIGLFAVEHECAVRELGAAAGGCRASLPTLNRSGRASNSQRAIGCGTASRGDGRLPPSENCFAHRRDDAQTFRSAARLLGFGELCGRLCSGTSRSPRFTPASADARR